MMNSIELFSGTGGLALGLQLSGFDHTALYEWDKDSCDNLNYNIQHGYPAIKDWKVYQTDVRTVHYDGYTGKIQLVAGGPPCQPFSLGGKHQAYNDKRDMFPEAVRAVREVRPKVFIFENVRGLLRKSFSEYFNYILLQLQHPEIIKAENMTWMEQAVNAILQGASGTDYDKARYFHDAILDRCSYNSGAVSVYQPMSCEAYGALVEGSAICEGYAKAFKLLCNRAGIACEIVGGTVNGEAHMWNYVQIGGDYYLVDATFDDAPGVGAYDYFLKGSSSVWDHLEDSSLLEGFSTGFSYPSLSSSDYLPSGADGRNTAETDNQTPAPADEEIVSAADATETGQADVEEESIPATGRHPAVVPPVEEGGCRISCLFSKNGRYWVKSADPSVFIRGKQSLPEGVNLQIFAFPEPGYRVAEITVISGDTAFSVQNCSSLAFSLEKDSQIRVVFEKAA